MKNSLRKLDSLDPDEDRQFVAFKNPDISNLSEVQVRGMLNFGKKHFDHQNWVNLMQSEKNWTQC